MTKLLSGKRLNPGIFGALLLVALLVGAAAFSLPGSALATNYRDGTLQFKLFQNDQPTGAGFYKTAVPGKIQLELKTCDPNLGSYMPTIIPGASPFPSLYSMIVPGGNDTLNRNAVNSFLKPTIGIMKVAKGNPWTEYDRPYDWNITNSSGQIMATGSVEKGDWTFADDRWQNTTLGEPAQPWSPSFVGLDPRGDSCGGANAGSSFWPSWYQKAWVTLDVSKFNDGSYNMTFCHGPRDDNGPRTDCPTDYDKVNFTVNTPQSPRGNIFVEARDTNGNALSGASWKFVSLPASQVQPADSEPAYYGILQGKYTIEAEPLTGYAFDHIQNASGTTISTASQATQSLSASAGGVAVRSWLDGIFAWVKNIFAPTAKAVLFEDAGCSAEFSGTECLGWTDPNSGGGGGTGGGGGGGGSSVPHISFILVYKKVATVPAGTPTLSVNLSSGQIKVGDTANVTATYDPDGSGPQAVVQAPSPVWSSSDGTVASISTASVVTGIKVGTTIITATYSGLSASANLTVTVASSPGAKITGHINISKEPINNGDNFDLYLSGVDHALVPANTVTHLYIDSGEGKGFEDFGNWWTVAGLESTAGRTRKLDCSSYSSYTPGKLVSVVGKTLDQKIKIAYGSTGYESDITLSTKNCPGARYSCVPSGPGPGGAPPVSCQVAPAGPYSTLGSCQTACTETPSYSCTGSIPAGNSACPGTGTGLTSSRPYTSVATCSASQNDKCEYHTSSSVNLSSSVPIITSFSPTSGPIGTQVLIKGTGLVSYTDGTKPSVLFGQTSIPADTYSNGDVQFAVPSTATPGTYSFVVVSSGVKSNAVNFTVTASATLPSASCPFTAPAGLPACNDGCYVPQGGPSGGGPNDYWSCVPNVPTPPGGALSFSPASVRNGDSFTISLSGGPASVAPTHLLIRTSDNDNQHYGANFTDFGPWSNALTDSSGNFTLSRTMNCAAYTSYTPGQSVNLTLGGGKKIYQQVKLQWPDGSFSSVANHIKDCSTSVTSTPDVIPLASSTTASSCTLSGSIKQFDPFPPQPYPGYYSAYYGGFYAGSGGYLLYQPPNSGPRLLHPTNFGYTVIDISDPGNPRSLMYEDYRVTAAGYALGGPIQCPGDCHSSIGSVAVSTDGQRAIFGMGTGGMSVPGGLGAIVGQPSSGFPGFRLMYGGYGGRIGENLLQKVGDKYFAYVFMRDVPRVADVTTLPSDGLDAITAADGNGNAVESIPYSLASSLPIGYSPTLSGHWITYTNGDGKSISLVNATNPLPASDLTAKQFTAADFGHSSERLSSFSVAQDPANPAAVYILGGFASTTMGLYYQPIATGYTLIRVLGGVPTIVGSINPGTGNPGPGELVTTYGGSLAADNAGNLFAFMGVRISKLGSDGFYSDGFYRQYSSSVRTFGATPGFFDSTSSIPGVFVAGTEPGQIYGYSGGQVFPMTCGTSTTPSSPPSGGGSPPSGGGTPPDGGGLAGSCDFTLTPNPTSLTVAVPDVSSSYVSYTLSATKPADLTCPALTVTVPTLKDASGNTVATPLSGTLTIAPGGSNVAIFNVQNVPGTYQIPIKAYGRGVQKTVNLGLTVQ